MTSADFVTDTQKLLNINWPDAKIYKRLKTFRTEYRNLQITDFNQAQYTHETFMASFLNAAYDYGCNI
jgi:hypothetical protein